MLRYKYFIIIFTLSLSSIPALQAQILNVEKDRVEVDTTTKWVGSLDLKLMLNNRSANRNERIQYLGINIESDVGYFSKQNSYLLFANLERYSVTGEAFINSGYNHLRFNLLRNRPISYEAFGQIQFDAGRGLNFRWLSGAGFRFRLLEQEKLELYLGTGGMYEYENWQLPQGESMEVVKRLFKSSNYISAQYELNDHTDFNIVSYYQVGYDQEDEVYRHRFSLNSNLLFEFTENISFKTSFSWAYENRPVIPIIKYVYVLENGIEINF
ncbi:MAG: DUF481 domain-containing protein [Candidatus Cyclobacteriaceae bacterium M3_2C_046]